MNKIAILLLTVIALMGLNLNAQNYTIDVNKSEIKWDARKVSGSGHSGVVTVKEGTLELANNKIKSAKIVVEMASITNTDGKDGQPNARLVGHLKGEEFFNVEKFKTADFVLTGSGEFVNGEAKVYGRLTIKGITQPLNFIAKKDNNTLTTTLAVDRTLYDVKYGSGKFFDGLGDNMIKDEFTLEIKLVTK